MTKVSFENLCNEPKFETLGDLKRGDYFYFTGELNRGLNIVAGSKGCTETVLILSLNDGNTFHSRLNNFVVKLSKVKIQYEI